MAKIGSKRNMGDYSTTKGEHLGSRNHVLAHLCRSLAISAMTDTQSPPTGKPLGDESLPSRKNSISAYS